LLPSLTPEARVARQSDAAEDDAAEHDAAAGVRCVERVIAAHLQAAWRTARDLGVASRDLEDVVQDVMLVVVRRHADIEPGRERAFVLATTVRVASNWRRGRRRKPAELTPSMDEIDGIDVRGPFPSPALAAESRQELKLVETALAAMTEAQRAAFTLFELEQLSGREIAEQLGVSEAVVFARVRRARAVFRRACEQARPGRTEDEGGART
jgi:RNA polymerase sigma-70 factor (ECF subfamily)